VVHLAAWAHKVGRADVAALNYINVEGSRFVAQLAVAAGIRRFVFLSSIKVNGESTSGIPYRENDAPSPEDEYGASKLAAEIEVRDICNQNGVECVIIRPPLVYGPGVKANFYRLLRLIGLGVPLPFGSLFNKRSMIGVANLSSFIEVCLTHAKAAGRTWLVSDREDLSTSELVARLGALMEKPPKLFKFPPEGLKLLAICLGQRTEIARLTGSLQVDASPALEELYWRPCTTVDEGLAQTVAAFKSGRP
jgi:UDP-glucose 4-epimerase